MVEVEDERVALDVLHDAGDRLAVGRGKAHDVADAVVAVGIAFGVERGAADTMNQRRIALAEGFAGGQRERFLAAAARPIRRASIAGASSPVPRDSVAGGVAKVSTKATPSPSRSR